MEFPKYKEDTTLVDLLNFDTWQGVIYNNESISYFNFH